MTSMLALRSLPARLSRPAVLVSRSNATVSTPSQDTPTPAAAPSSIAASKAKSVPKTLAARTTLSSSSIPASQAASPKEEATTKTKGRKRKGTPRQRPEIDSARPRFYNRPLPYGILPAYDIALELLNKDSKALKQEAQALQAKIDKKEAAVQKLKVQVGETGNVDVQAGARMQDEELEKMREKLNILQVQSEINLPSVRWKVANAMANFNSPVDRYLVEQRWRKDGDLDLLMERIYQMKVVPDVLPELRPTVDVHVVARNTFSMLRKTSKLHGRVEPGVFLKPEQTTTPPDVYAAVFHTDERLYTLLLVDPDVPDEANASFTTYLHCLKPNIALSAGQHQILGLDDHTRYIPPHPQEGTPYHRYVLLLLPQPPIGAPNYSLNLAARAEPSKPTSVKLDIPVVPDEQRLGFNVRAFANRWGLNGAKGGGAHMWREVWNSSVSKVYKKILKTPEPRYGRPRKEDPYAEIKQTKRYIIQ